MRRRSSRRRIGHGGLSDPDMRLSRTVNDTESETENLFSGRRWIKKLRIRKDIIERLGNEPISERELKRDLRRYKQKEIDAVLAILEKEGIIQRTQDGVVLTPPKVEKDPELDAIAVDNTRDGSVITAIDQQGSKNVQVIDMNPEKVRSVKAEANDGMIAISSETLDGKKLQTVVATSDTEPPVEPSQVSASRPDAEIRDVDQDGIPDFKLKSRNVSMKADDEGRIEIRRITETWEPVEKVYYAHSKLKYEPRYENQEMDYIYQRFDNVEDLFIINPSSYERRWKQSRLSEHEIMQECFKLIDGVDVVVFTDLGDGWIGRGVFQEVKYARAIGKPVVFLDDFGDFHEEFDIEVVNPDDWQYYARVMVKKDDRGKEKRRKKLKSGRSR